MYKLLEIKALNKNKYIADILLLFYVTYLQLGTLVVIIL